MRKVKDDEGPEDLREMCQCDQSTKDLISAYTCMHGRKISSLLEGKYHNPETAWD